MLDTPEAVVDYTEIRELTPNEIEGEHRKVLADAIKDSFKNLSQRIVNLDKEYGVGKKKKVDPAYYVERAAIQSVMSRDMYLSSEWGLDANETVKRLTKQTGNNVTLADKQGRETAKAFIAGPASSLSLYDLVRHQRPDLIGEKIGDIDDFLAPPETDAQSGVDVTFALGTDPVTGEKVVGLIQLKTSTDGFMGMKEIVDHDDVAFGIDKHAIKRMVDFRNKMNRAIKEGEYNEGKPENVRYETWAMVIPSYDSGQVGDHYGRIDANSSLNQEFAELANINQFFRGDTKHADQV